MQDMQLMHKILNELGWKPVENFNTGIKKQSNGILKIKNGISIKINRLEQLARGTKL